MSLQCNQCDDVFSTNFLLYQHKKDKHGPVIGLVTHPAQGQEPENPDRNKRPRTDDHVGNPKKYRRVLEEAEYEQESDSQVTGVKRLRNDSDEAGLSPAAKHRKIENRGTKRRATSPINSDTESKIRRIEARGTKRYYSGSDSDSIHSSKNRRIAAYGTKRSRADLSDGDRPSKKRHVHEYGKKRYLSHSSSDSEGESKYRKISSSDTKIERMGLIDRLKKEIEKWKRLHRAEKTKSKNVQKECEEKIKRLDEQLEEIREINGDYELTKFSKAVINSVTINNFNRIRELISQNGLNSVLRSRKYLLSLQKLFLGLSYGIVPITTSQRVALTAEETSMVKKLENASVEQIRSHIKRNKLSFLKLFSVINESIKFVVKAYNRYGN